MQLISQHSLVSQLTALGVAPGDGVFVHASLRAIGPVIGGPRAVILALHDAVGGDGLIAMPGVSTDAYFPEWLDRSSLSQPEVMAVEAAVPGFDPAPSPTTGMGAIAELFRTWPGTVRSAHPGVSVCINGRDAAKFTQEHARGFACGPGTPFVSLMERPAAKVLLLGVGWNRCTMLHTAETLARPRRLKVRRQKEGGRWHENEDVADDIGRLFPAAGASFEATGAVSEGSVGNAVAKLAPMAELVRFATAFISAANRESGDRA